jgi:hypothetical protein
LVYTADVIRAAFGGIGGGFGGKGSGAGFGLGGVGVADFGLLGIATTVIPLKHSIATGRECVAVSMQAASHRTFLGDSAIWSTAFVVVSLRELLSAS